MLSQILKCIQTYTQVHMDLIYACVCVGHIQAPYSITDELLPAHDKSPPVCGISVVVHVGARPDPTVSALSPTTWGPAWLTDGRISSDKKHQWLITEAHLSPYGGPSVPRTIGPKKVHLSLSTWFPGADSPRICVVITTAMCMHTYDCQLHHTKLKCIQHTWG